jgi:CBS domain containing-hemolysin-like protein
MTTLFFSTLLLLVVSFCASCSEAALFAVSYSKVAAAADQGRTGASSLLEVKDRMARPIMTLVILNNFGNVLGSMLVGAMADDILGSQLLGVFSAVLTFLIIVFGEILPKTIGERYADPLAFWLARPILVASVLFMPGIWLIETLTRPITGGRDTSPTSEEEIRTLSRLGEQAGVIDQVEHQIINRAFRLNDVTARELMTPYAKADTLDGKRTVTESKEFLKEAHSRIPVWEDNIDNIVGVVHQRDLLQALVDGSGAETVSSLVGDPLFVPFTMTGDDLLRHFQTTKQHLAIVVNEGGTVLGLVTLEDVLEELVGEIADETDVVPQELVEKLEDGRIMASAGADTELLNLALGVELPSGRIGELLIEHLGRIPSVGERIVIEGVVFTIVKATPRLVEQVAVELAPAGEADT